MLLREHYSRLTLEHLTDRIVPAVGGLGLVEGHFATIVGDDGPNDIIVRNVGGLVSIDGGTFVTASGPRTTLAVSELKEGITIITGGGNDRVWVDPALTIPVGIDLGEGNDIGVAGGGPTRFSGGPGNDRLFGGRGNDRLNDFAGDDFFSGGGGTDVAFSGPGRDRFDRTVESRPDFASGSDALVNAVFAAPAFPAVATPPRTPTLGAFREPTARAAILDGDSLVLQGSAAADTFVLRNAAGRLSLADGLPIRTASAVVSSIPLSSVRFITVLGYSGNDTIDLGAVSTGAVVVAGAGDDTVRATNGADVVFGGAGNDSLAAYSGNDRVYAGSGNDRVWLDVGNDVGYGGAGDDMMYGWIGNDVVTGEAGNDFILGDDGDDTLSGGAGNDEMFGFDGADDLNGGEGNDVLVGEAGDDSIEGGLGDDALYGGDGEDFLDGGEGSDRLFGLAGSDILVGGTGDDKLYGGADADSLLGDEGNDELFGEDGDDEHDGGDGVDVIGGGNGDDLAAFVEPEDVVSPDTERVEFA